MRIGIYARICIDDQLFPNERTDVQLVFGYIRFISAGHLSEIVYQSQSFKTSPLTAVFSSSTPGTLHSNSMRQSLHSLWVSVRFGIHRSHTYSSEPQKLSERWMKITPLSSATHLFKLFIRLKFCWKNEHFEKVRGDRENCQGKALISRQILHFSGPRW